MNEQKIITLYTKKDKSTYEIAEMMDTYPNKIRRVLKNTELHSRQKARLRRTHSKQELQQFQRRVRLEPCKKN